LGAGGSAVDRLTEQIAQAKEEQALEDRLAHLRNAQELALKRFALEVEMEDLAATLEAKLRDLEGLDQEQCAELREGGAQHPTHPFAWIVEEWFVSRFPGWFPQNPRIPTSVRQTLADMDPLATEPGEQLQTTPAPAPDRSTAGEAVPHWWGPDYPGHPEFVGERREAMDAALSGNGTEGKDG
jgi:hypothetical protein